MELWEKNELLRHTLRPQIAQMMFTEAQNWARLKVGSPNSLL